MLECFPVTIAGSGFTSENGVEFTLLDDVNFKVSSSLDTMDIAALDPASGNIPTNFRLTKKGIAVSGKQKEQEFIFSDAVSFDSIVLSEDKVTEIVSVVDSSGNKFYEVPFLAQDTVFEDEENISLNDPSLSQYKNDAPYLLKLIKTARRFTTRVRDDNKMEFHLIV